MKRSQRNDSHSCNGRVWWPFPDGEPPTSADRSRARSFVDPTNSDVSHPLRGQADVGRTWLDNKEIAMTKHANRKARVHAKANTQKINYTTALRADTATPQRPGRAVPQVHWYEWTTTGRSFLTVLDFLAPFESCLCCRGLVHPLHRRRAPPPPVFLCRF